MKKFLAILLSVAMLSLPMTAFAGKSQGVLSSASIDYINNKITFYGNVDAKYAGRTATLLVVNPGKSLSDFFAGTDKAVINWADEAKIDKDGNFQFEVGMGNSISGDYNFAVTVDDVKLQGEQFYYADASTAVSEWRKFEGYTATADVKSFLNQNKEIIQIKDILPDFENLDVDPTLNAAAQETVLSGILESKAKNYVELKAALIDCIAAYKMNQPGNETMFDDLFNAWLIENPALENENTLYEKLTDTKKAEVKATVKDAKVKSRVAAENLYKDKVLLTTLNSQNLAQGIGVFIKKNAANMLDELAMRKYLSLRDSSKVDSDLVRLLPFSSMADFENAFIAAVENRLNMENKKAQSSGGGGGLGNIAIQPKVEPTTEPTAIQNPFSDVADNFWAKDAILNLYAKGIVAGQGNGNFNSNATISRAEFVQMVVKAFGFTMQGEGADFKDVSNEWFANAVQIAYTNGIVNGTTATTFSPEKNITRQDMMVILTNAAKAKGIALTTAEASFTDEADIAGYAKDAVAAMVGSKVVSGYTDGSVKPQNNASRAEAAVMLNGLLGL